MPAGWFASPPASARSRFGADTRSPALFRERGFFIAAARLALNLDAPIAGGLVERFIEPRDQLVDLGVRDHEGRRPHHRIPRGADHHVVLPAVGAAQPPGLALGLERFARLLVLDELDRRDEPLAAHLP